MSKKYLFIPILLFCLTLHCAAQKAMTFMQAKDEGLSIAHLDSIYASGIHADVKLSVFKSNQEQYISSYQKLLQDLGKHLKINNFKWTAPTKGFNRIYFDKNGAIDYFLYSFKPNQLTPDQEIKFAGLLQSFIKDYKFLLKADKNFAQCSPVTYMPSDK